MTTPAFLLRALLLLFATGLLVATSAGAAEEVDEKGWTAIHGGPGTGCALDTPYTFYWRPAVSDRLTVYFQGGGACWNDRTCDPRGEPTYDPSVSEWDHPARIGGIFDFSRTDNPLRDYSVLFVPYCTGDVHIGAQTVEYATKATEDAPAGTVTIRHHGARNVAYALDWLKARKLEPKKLFVAGTSAGAIPAPLYAARLASLYPKARVVQIADGAGGYRAESVPGVLRHWGATATIRATFPEAADIADTRDFKDLYTLAGQQAPDIHYAQVNYAGDEVQLSFLRLLGVEDTPLAPLLAANLSDMRNSVPWFRAYTVPGEAHGILGSEAFYSLVVDGVGFRDWVADLIEGRDVEDVGETKLGSESNSMGKKLTLTPIDSDPNFSDRGQAVRGARTR